MSFDSLPKPVKIGMLVMGGAGILAIARLIAPDTRVFLIILAGIFIVGLLVVGYVLLVKRMKKRKSAPMEQGIEQNAGATPQAVSEPARRARLDDMRRNFKDGLDKFRAAGRNLYSLPWYIIAGEPGSGKTEAIRHCNVGFPPGLQDELQGAGGTINMNWWFTNHAVILDTAGRLLFEEVKTSQTSEWEEFLKLLHKHRYNCPVNGLLLVIPVDSLIKDTADEIERKGKRIAQQLHLIQRTLDVRFPVFVVITKCDLLNGFREFFEDVTDPQLQHQVVGWSNPAPIDERFNPDHIDQYFETLFDGINRRRLGLLIDPVHTEDPSQRRVDQVDALYAFPQSLKNILPRLKLYLQMVFVGGDVWSPRPLFCRGVYLTSSMREGSALDADLSEALGVPVDALPEGKVWERERAFFLKDLFMEKVFRERGLVTRAGNVGRQYLKRRGALVGTGFVCFILLAFLTWLGTYTLKKRIGGQTDYWVAAALDEDWQPPSYGGAAHWKPLVEPNFAGSTQYSYGRRTIQIRDTKMSTIEFHTSIMELMNKPIRIPWVFSLARIGRGVEKGRREAQRVIFEAGVLRPVVDASKLKMHGESGPWSDHATGVLAQLIRIGAQAMEMKTKGGATPEGKWQLVDLDPFFRYVLNREKAEDKDAQEQNIKSYDEDKEALKATFEEIYSTEYGQEEWPPRLLASAESSDLPSLRECVAKGVERFTAYWGGKSGVQNERLAGLRTLADDLQNLNVAEKALLGIGVEFASINTRKEFEDARNQWRARLADCRNIKTNIDQNMDVLQGMAMEAARSETISQVGQAARQAWENLLNETRPLEPELEAEEEGDKTWIVETRNKLEESRQGVEDELVGIIPDEAAARYDSQSLSLATEKDGRRARLYEVRSDIYAIADRRLNDDGALEGASLAALFEAIKASNDEAKNEIARLFATCPNSGIVKEAVELSTDSVLPLAARNRNYMAITGVFDRAPRSKEALQQAVETQAKKEKPLPEPNIWMTHMQGEQLLAQYHPEAAAVVVGDWASMGQMLKQEKLDALDRNALLKRYESLQKEACDQYLDDYVKYWTETVPNGLDATSKEWKAVRDGLERIRVGEIHTLFEEPCTTIRRALSTNFLRGYEEKKKGSIDRANGALDRAKSQAFAQDCRRVVNNWTALPAEGSQARDALLKITPQDFSRRYVLQYEEPKKDFVLRYWENLSFELQRALADEVHRTRDEYLQELKEFARFPLDLGGIGDNELTLDEVTKARTAVAGIQPEEKPGTIGGGAPSGDPNIDEQLKRIRGRELSKPDKERISKIAMVLAALPQKPGETRKCRLSVLGVGEQKRLLIERGQSYYEDSVLPVWRRVMLVYGDKRRGIHATESVQNVQIGEWDYPGDAAALHFFLHPDDEKPHRIVDLGRGWAPIRFLHTQKAQRQSDATKWYVPLSLQDDQDKSRIIWLQLEFGQELPKTGDWPSLKGQ